MLSAKWQPSRLGLSVLNWLSLVDILKILNSDIGKSAGPRSSTGENSGGPMKTLIVQVLLSSKQKSCMEPLYGDFDVEKN